MHPLIKDLSPWLMRKKFSLVDGEWLNNGAQEIFETINPSTEEAIAQIASSDQRIVDHAAEAARKALKHPSWKGLSNKARSGALRSIASLIRANKNALAAIESLDNGKLYREAIGDVDESAEVFDYYAEWINKIYGETCPVGPGFLNYTVNEPIGVCGLIIPWNFPLLLSSWKLAPCLAMGNTAIIKPSPFTSLSLLFLMELVVQEKILPPGVVNVVLGGASIGQALAVHKNIDHISFTGSTAVGKSIVKSSGESNLKTVSLELGGKSPNIVFDDVKDLEPIIDNSFSAMFSHKGEKCSEPTRFFIHEEHYEVFLLGLKKRAESVRCGEPFLESSDQGPQCNREQMEKILCYIEEAKREGAQLIAGGSRDESGANAKGYFVRPTIFADVKSHMKIAKDEIFGPVLSVSSFRDEEEVIHQANDSIYGLAAGIFTDNVKRAHRVASLFESGMVFINRYGCYDLSSPFGGFKQSGWGKEMALHSLASYKRTKSVWLKVTD